MKRIVHIFLYSVASLVILIPFASSLSTRAAALKETFSSAPQRENSLARSCVLPADSAASDDSMFIGCGGYLN